MRGAAFFLVPHPRTLKGHTMNLHPNHRIANAAMASALAGILTVSLAACNKSAESTAIAPQSSSVGHVIDDTVITTRIKTALMADPKINSYDFKVETRKGEVMLSGFVDSQAQLDLALATAHAVEGVTGIQNNVALKAGSASVGNKVDDGITTTKVKAALMADPLIQSVDIHVVTRIGEAQLSGFVNTQAQMDRAVWVAGATEGVHKVSNEMKLKK
jgi:hyperosmotically inducible protein